ncbi:MAG: hypothetical protein WAN35_16265 [Terracidiphilus sp.]
MPASGIDQQELYRPAFARNCMTLLVCAHRKLTPASFQTAEETHITGELIKEAQNLIESDEAESWMEHLEVKDDPPQNVPGRFGKKRPRIDIEFVQVVRGRHPRFHIEAKRLYRSDSVNEYFGSGGLAMFVEGSYAVEWPSAGMLGYVQSDDCAAWLNRLEKGLKTRSMPEWKSAGWSGDGLDDVKTSCHERSDKKLSSISIHHLLLEFC